MVTLNYNLIAIAKWTQYIIMKLTILLQSEAPPQHRVQVRRALPAGPVRRLPLPERRHVQQRQERQGLPGKFHFGGKFKRRRVFLLVPLREVRRAALRARPGPLRLRPLPLWRPGTRFNRKIVA